MNQLRYLKPAYLYKTNKAIQSNGAIKETFDFISLYYVGKEELTDNVSASVYGARMNRIIRITSPRNTLESFLLSKIDPTLDNVTDYVIVMDDKRYSITTVKSRWVDVEMNGTFSQTPISV